MSFAKTLTRDEMKNVMAGTGCEGTCLFCHTPGGYEGWYRNDEPGDKDAACGKIYQAYDSEDVEGHYTDCGDAPGSVPVYCN